MPTQVNYNKIIHHSASDIENVLLNFKAYNLWWPKKFKIKHSVKNNQNYLSFSPFIGIKITWLISKKDNKITTSYITGPVKGNGEWIIEKLTDKTTKLHYSINVSPRIPLVKSIPFPFNKPFGKIHLGHMDDLFICLENHLNLIVK